MTCFIVEKDTPGLKFGAKEKKVLHVQCHVGHTIAIAETTGGVAKSLLAHKQSMVLHGNDCSRHRKCPGHAVRCPD